MKRRNLLLSLLLVGATAVVSVGYAALNRILFLDTKLTADMNNENLAIEFHQTLMGYKIDQGGSAVKVEMHPNVDEAQKIAFTVGGLSEHGDQVTVYSLIVNNSEEQDTLNATLGAPSILVTHGLNNEVATDQDATNNPSLFKGNHFTIEASYVYDSSVAIEGGSSLEYENMGQNIDGNPYLETKEEAKSETSGHGVWAKVVFTLDEVVVEPTDYHIVQVSFSATSTNKLS